MSVSPNTILHFDTFRIFRMHASKYISLGPAAINVTCTIGYLDLVVTHDRLKKFDKNKIMK